jgi:hypothetical protein
MLWTIASLQAERGPLAWLTWQTHGILLHPLFPAALTIVLLDGRNRRGELETTILMTRQPGLPRSREQSTESPLGVKVLGDSVAGLGDASRDRPKQPAPWARTGRYEATAVPPSSPPKRGPDVRPRTGPTRCGQHRRLNRHRGSDSLLVMSTEGPSGAANSRPSHIDGAHGT